MEDRLSPILPSCDFQKDPIKSQYGSSIKALMSHGSSISVKYQG
jgi:hypothetical protein